MTRRLSRDTARHKLTVVTGGVTTVHYPDLTPGVTIYADLTLRTTIYYTPGVSGAPVVLDRLWSDSTGRLWSDATTRQWAA